MRDARRWLDAFNASGRRPIVISTRPFRAELDDHVRAFVDRPDVVLRVDADAVRHLEAVETLADLADELAVLVELEEARRRCA